jgi:predicted TIM-barrel fold metal-dependent hydrolase
MRIDIHAHYFPTEYLDLLDRFGSSATNICRGMRAGGGTSDLAARLQMMDAAGVDIQVLSATPAPPYFRNEADSVAAARLANDTYADLVKAHPQRFAALAVTPMPHVEASLAELRRALDELGMAGATIATSVLGRSLADPAFEPLYADLDRRNATVLVHPAGESACSPLIAEYGITWMLGAPMEDTIGALHLIVSGLVTRYRNINFVVCHLGGALPMLLPRFDRQYTWEAPQTPEAPSNAARRMWYETTAHGHIPALRLAAETLGADRLLLGSDYPYQQDDWYARAVSYVLEAGLSKAETDAILGTTAAALLGLDLD